MSRPTRMDNKISAIVYQIKRLNMRELELLAQELRKLGFPPSEPTEVGVRPRRSPPVLSGAATQPWPKESVEIRREMMTR